MTTPMNDQELAAFKERLAKLAHTGTEGAVRAYVNEQFPRLPKDMQDAITASLFVDSMTAEAADLERPPKEK